MLDSSSIRNWLIYQAKINVSISHVWGFEEFFLSLATNKFMIQGLNHEPSLVVAIILSCVAGGGEEVGPKCRLVTGRR